MYQEYLAEFRYSTKAFENSKVSFLIPTRGIYGEVGLNTFRNAIGAHYLPHSSEYVAPPSIDVVRKWFPTIGYGEEVSIKGTLRKSLLLPRWRLLMAHIIQCLGESSSAMDSNLSRPSVSTPVDTEMHKEDQQATGGPTSLGVTSKERAYPQLNTEMHKEDQQATGGPTSLGVTSKERAYPQLSSGMSALNLNKPNFSTSFIIHALGHDVSADFTAEADPGLSASNDSIPPQQDQTKSVSEGLETVFTQPTTKRKQTPLLYMDLANLVSQIQPSFKDLDSPEDDPIIIVDKSDKDEPNAETKDTLVPRSSSLSSLPTKMKDLPSKFNELTEEIKGLKTQVHKLEIKLPKELKEIPTKLEDFTKTATSLTSQVAKLKTLQ
nr:hypothetical protein [Tanacetum cinerariifolium]